MSELIYRFARLEDLPEIKRLLDASQLPSSDIEPHLEHFIIAIDGERIIANIGVELLGKYGLLRSFVVEDTYRHRSIGLRLYNLSYTFLHDQGVSQIHLLTDKAAGYFQKLGFKAAERNAAPPEIRMTNQFSSLCSKDVIYMINQIPNNSTRFYKSTLHRLKFESQSQSKYWAISTNQQSLTWFEVPPQKDFETHQHECDQTTYVLKGELFFEVNSIRYCLEPGDLIFIPAGQKHKVWTENQSASAIDIWNPANPDYK